MDDLWRTKLKQRLALQKRLELPGERGKFAQELRDLRKERIRIHLYRGYGVEQPDKFATNQESITPIAAE